MLCGGPAGDGSADDQDDLAGVLQDSRAQTGKTSNKASILDKYTIQEKLVPSLKAIKTKEPAVMMATLNVFREVGKIADSEFVALEVIPILWTFSMGPLLDVSQFQDFMSLIKSLSSKVEHEQIRKLQDLSPSGDPTVRNGLDDSSPWTNGISGHAKGDSVRNDFERLVLGNKFAPSSGGDEFDVFGNLTAEPGLSRPSRSSTVALESQGVAARSMTSHLSPSRGFRSITPDYNMNSFPALEPASREQQQGSLSASAQWGSSSSSIWDAPKPAATWGPSLSALASIGASSSNNTNAAAPTQPSNEYSAFSIPPPPKPGDAVNTGWHAPFASNAGYARGSSVGTPSQPLKNSQKQGLDKYESLL